MADDQEPSGEVTPPPQQHEERSLDDEVSPVKAGVPVRAGEVVAVVLWTVLADLMIFRTLGILRACGVLRLGAADLFNHLHPTDAKAVGAFNCRIAGNRRRQFGLARIFAGDFFCVCVSGWFRDVSGRSYALGVGEYRAGCAMRDGWDVPIERLSVAKTSSSDRRKRTAICWPS